MIDQVLFVVGVVFAFISLTDLKWLLIDFGWSDLGKNEIRNVYLCLFVFVVSCIMIYFGLNGLL